MIVKMPTLRSARAAVDGLSGYYKLSLILAGYSGALLAAFAACYVVEKFFPGPDPFGGMQAFGDMLRFLGLFGFLSLFPTALALYFLRPVEKFWIIFSYAALALALTAPLAALTFNRRFLAPWTVLAGFLGLMEVLASPLLGLAFAICAWLAPFRRPRQLLFAASAIEFIVAGGAFLLLVFIRHRGW